MKKLCLVLCVGALLAGCWSRKGPTPSETALISATRLHPAARITENLQISGFVDTSYLDAHFQSPRAAYLHHGQLAQSPVQDQRKFEREGEPRDFVPGEEPSTEEYDRIYENPFLEAEGNPLSALAAAR